MSKNNKSTNKSSKNDKKVVFDPNVKVKAKKSTDSKPVLNEIKVVLSNGEQITIKSTLSNKKEMQVHVDTYSHPAWTGVNKFGIEKDGRVTAFNQKYKDLY
ncbi:50S ribosomal protein L31 [Candidatus Nesciobacter abundans]|uniref:50S ribosomal protein L31 n=1 Tax=Candidatus Nesciobacter abundans TaxID=2601668 RepID=A0A5C0UH03_9PROT|nr:50S ribosomal protein L31 [Candidatus Nesciobacter abundans]QEK38977.1 50S ribosomal protein L31 [Candidatus Nesciobacter abundans]